MEKLTQLRIQKRIVHNNACQLTLKPLNNSLTSILNPNYLTFIFSENGQEIRSSFFVKKSSKNNQTLEIEVNDFSDQRIPKFLTEIAQVGSVLVANII